VAGTFPSILCQADGTALTELAVFGERNSGTNLAHTLLQRNIPAFADSPGDRIGKYGFRYGWKHGFPQMLAAPRSTLAIGLFRYPETWLRAMHRRAWHATPALKAFSFSEFIRAEWQTRVDERNFGVDEPDPRALSELQWDRHPITGARFAHLPALRNAKTAGFLSLPQRFANCLLIRHEDLQAAPEQFVTFVAEAFQIAQRDVFQPVTERRGKPSDGTFSQVAHAPLTVQDQEFVWSQLDHAQEKRLGYSPKQLT